MMRKWVVEIDDISSNLSIDPKILYNAVNFLNQTLFSFYNFNKQANILTSGKICSALLTLPNSLKIHDRVALLSGTGFNNLETNFTGNQRDTYYTPPTPMLFQSDKVYLFNNKYINIPSSRKFMNIVDSDYIGEIKVAYNRLDIGDLQEHFIFLPNVDFKFLNFLYTSSTRSITLSPPINASDIVSFTIVEPHYKTYTALYSTNEIASIVGGKANIKIVERVKFTSDFKIEGDATLVFENDYLIVRDGVIKFSSTQIINLYNKFCNITHQNVSIPVGSANITEAFNSNPNKYKSLTVSLNFLQQGDYLDNVEIVKVNGNTLVMSESVYSGTKSIKLGTFKRWESTVGYLKENIKVNYSFEELSLMTDAERRLVYEKMLIALEKVKNEFKIFNFGRLQGFTIRSLNTIISWHNSGRHDLALNDLFNGDLMSYQSRTDQDSNSGVYLSNVIQQTIYRVGVL